MRRLAFCTTTVLFVFLLTNQDSVVGQSQSVQTGTPYKPAKLASRHSGPLAKADFGEVSRETPADEIRRRARETRRKNFFPFISDPGRLTDGQQETTAVLMENIVQIENSDPAYPASLSAAVIVATVMGAKGFVSEDRTYVYSEYRMRIDEILKQDAAANLAVGRQVTVARPGAAVTFPSGHISHYMVHGRGHPKLTKQYLLFLWKPILDQPEYEPIYGGVFELSEGRVYPLDDEGNYYRGPDDEDALLLLAKIRKAIVSLPK